jgi:ABC-2 type transport system ATP-binding protein
MMAGGKLVRQGTLQDVLADGAPTIRVDTPDLETAIAIMQQMGLEAAALGPDGPVTARLGSMAVEDVANALVHADVRLHSLNVDRPDLEELFVSITGEGFDVLR